MNKAFNSHSLFTLKLSILYLSSLLLLPCLANSPSIMSYLAFSTLVPVLETIEQALQNKTHISHSTQCTNISLITLIQEVIQAMGLDPYNISIRQWKKDVPSAILSPFMIVDRNLIIINESHLKTLPREAIQGLIGHEIAHIYHDDQSTLTYQKIMLIIPIHLTCRFVARMFSISYSLTLTTGILEYVINTSLCILNIRRTEKRADLTVSKMMPQATKGLIKALKNTKEICRGDNYLDLTHPLLSTRIDYLEKELQKIETTPA